MAKVNMSTTLNVPARTVWDTIGRFNALADWHPAIEKSEETTEGGDRIRRLSLAGGGTIVERLEDLDEGARACTYSIQESPLPISGYLARLSVRELEGGTSCEVEWSSEFEASGAPEHQAIEAIQGIYQAGFDSLRKMFGG